MFEGSLVESRGLVTSRTQRWSAFGSAAFQLMLATLIVVIPLMRPQSIKLLKEIPHLTAPILPPRPPVIVRTSTSNMPSAGSTAPSAVAQANSGTPHFTLRPGTPPGDEPVGTITNLTIGGGPNLMPGLPSGGPEVTVVRPAITGPVNVSGGVTAGMLLAPIRPTYPPIAKAAGIQGPVVIEAIISKAGKIESAHVVSGPPMLRQAALDAVEAAHYHPYLLTGEPVEVETTVTVVFRLGE
ncbi:MAG TPA: energy transducer TonB [Acidobacteriaceae bacterium]|nr:energy transducer TonB [Acidobacteriaceae bacterium]